MKAVIVFILVVINSLLQAPPRIAALDLAGDDNGAVRAVLEEGAIGFELQDASQTRAAARGAKYDGSLNLDCDQARALGGSLGCDYYFLGRVHNVRRLDSDNRAYFEAAAAIFLVESRSGRLILFDLPTVQLPTPETAFASLTALIRSRLGKYRTAIASGNEQRLRNVVEPVAKSEPMIEVLDGEVASAGLAAPVFYQRLKPSYTTEAALAEVAATVDLKVVFGADGKVGDIELTRWAGFGLDEAAINTARSLRFKPAERNGRPLSVRALVRYNFSRPKSATEREAEADRLRRSLRNIQKPD